MSAPKTRPSPAPQGLPWRDGLRSARANIVPGLALQAVALTLVLAYYWHAPTRELLGRLVNLREHTGYLFGMVSTGLAGGVVPVLYLWSRRATRGRYDGWQALALIALWAYKGLEIEFLYRKMALVIGAHPSVLVVIAKMIIDQFVYCPLFAVPVTVLAYEWVDSHFNNTEVKADFRAGGWYRRRVLRVMIPNAVVWVPSVAIIYSLPTPLQLPLQNLVLCFYTLLLSHLVQRKLENEVAI